MILALTTPLISQGTFTEHQVFTAITSQPDRTQYNNLEVREIVARTLHWCAVFGFNADLVFSQMVHETNWFRFTGDVQFGQHNFAGLGATGGVPGHSFPDINAGVLAVVAHHAVYRWGRKEHWPFHLQQYAGEHVDPRYDEVLSTGNGGKMHVLGDYRGTWAVPGLRYPENLITRSTQIDGFSTGGSMAGDIPGIPFILADGRHYTAGRTVAWPDMIILHHTDGFDSLNWLTVNPNSNVSATCILWHDGTIRAQLVRFADTPHTTGNMNPRSLSIEWERYWTDPSRRQATITEKQYANIADSVTKMWLAEKARGNPHFQGVPRQDQINKHNDFSSTGCPQNLDVDRVWRNVVARLQAPTDNALVLNGVPVVLGFKGHVLRMGEARNPADPIAGLLSVFGYPLAPEYKTATGSAQRFERTTLLWTPNVAAPWDIVTQFKDDPPPEVMGA